MSNNLDGNNNIDHEDYVVESPIVEDTTDATKFSGGDYKHKVHQGLGNHVVDDEAYYGVLRDVILWKRWKISGGVILIATILWVLLQVYGFNFIPLASWTAMAFVTLVFFYGSFLRLLHKDEPNLEWEMTEERAKEMANYTKKVMEKGIRWMFNVTCEREWYTFAVVIFTLLLLAYLGRYFDLMTFLYAGTLIGMTLPAIYVHKEDKIKEYGEKVTVHGSRMYHKVDDKVFSRLNLKHNQKKKKDE